MFEPENDLERSLLRAAAEPAHGPAFLRAMFNGTTFVPLEFEGAPPTQNAEGKLVFPEGTRLKLRAMRVGDQDYLPFFTAASRARTTLKGKFVVTPGVTREYFERHPGKQFVLNPGHEHMRTFASEEVNRLLAGQFSASAAEPAKAKAAEPKAETKPVEAKPVEAKPIEPKPPEIKPEVPKPAPPAAPEKSPVIKPTELEKPIATKPLFAEESFVLKTFPTPKPTKPVAERPPAYGKTRWTPSI
jgi:hypothetical protein